MQPGVDYQGSGFNAVADLDGDGVPELITGSYGPDMLTGKVTLRFYKQSGGNFTEAARLNPAATVLSAGANGCAWISVGDLDGDKRPDLAVLWEATGVAMLELLHNDGGLQFSDVTVPSLGGYVTKTPDNNYPAGLYRLSDLDGDGDVDLFVGFDSEDATSFAGGATNSIYLNDGKGKLSPLAVQIGGKPATAADIDTLFGAAGVHGVPLVLDADGDGVQDLVFIDESHVGKPPAVSPTDYFVYVARSKR